MVFHLGRSQYQRWPISRSQYQRCLIEKTESVVHRMRWKAHFYLNDDGSRTENAKFGLPSKKCGPPIKELKAFEDDLVNLISSISYRKVSDPFLDDIEKDMERVNNSENIYLFADKTGNIYETDPSLYNKLLTENITKSYKVNNDNIYRYSQRYS